MRVPLERCLSSPAPSSVRLQGSCLARNTSSGMLLLSLELPRYAPDCELLLASPTYTYIPWCRDGTRSLRSGWVWFGSGRQRCAKACSIFYPRMLRVSICIPAPCISGFFLCTCFLKQWFLGATPCPLQFLNFHNEMAYLPPETHLGPFGLFCCGYAPLVGGWVQYIVQAHHGRCTMLTAPILRRYTPIADTRKVYTRLQQIMGHDHVPTHFQYVIKRKCEGAPKAPPGAMSAGGSGGGYIDFLKGKCELEGRL